MQMKYKSKADNMFEMICMRQWYAVRCNKTAALVASPFGIWSSLPHLSDFIRTNTTTKL